MPDKPEATQATEVAQQEPLLRYRRQETPANFPGPPIVPSVGGLGTSAGVARRRWCSSGSCYAAYVACVASGLPGSGPHVRRVRSHSHERVELKEIVRAFIARRMFIKRRRWHISRCGSSGVLHILRAMKAHSRICVNSTLAWE